jgi:hypothetical protein
MTIFLPIYTDEKKDSKAKISKEIWNLPMRIAICGKSLISGKTYAIINLLGRPFNDDDLFGQMFYRKEFKSENIYLVCKTASLDKSWRKFIEMRKIPESNISTEYDEDRLVNFYFLAMKNFIDLEDRGEEPPHIMIIFDDMSFDGSLKKKLHGAISFFFCNGRHIRISVIVTSQKYTDLLTTCRENMNGAILFGCTPKQRDIIAEDCNHLDNKRDFNYMFNMCTKKKHHFLAIRYDDGLDPAKMYLNSDLQPIFTEYGDTYVYDPDEMKDSLFD